MSDRVKVVAAPEEFEEFYKTGGTPGSLFRPGRCHTVFLGGSIDLGAAENWQEKTIQRLQRTKAITPTIIYNPRRAEWTASTDMTMENPEFVRQVKWEIKYLTRATTTFFYFDPGGQAPISLLELGIRAGLQASDPNSVHDVMVCCPPGYWRAANVEIVAREFGFDFCQDFEEAYQQLSETIKHGYD